MPQPVAPEMPATEVLPPRVTGTAPVPAPQSRKRRWHRAIVGGNPEPRDTTLELPADERAALEAPPPVDPWAGHPVADVLPPTLPYPAPQPVQAAAPANPAIPPPQHPPVRPMAAPPPGWHPPPGYVLVVRRRRRWPWILLVLTVFVLACCCGLPAYVAKPMWEQYPATASLPEQIADLRLRDDAETRQTTQRLERDMRAAHLISEGTFAGVYTTPTGKRVTVFGVTGFRLDPESAVETEISRLTPAYGLTEVRTVPTGKRGEHVRCGVGQDDGEDIVACTWADHGSLGTALFTRLSVEDSAALLATLRAEILAQG